MQWPPLPRAAAHAHQKPNTAGMPPLAAYTQGCLGEVQGNKPGCWKEGSIWLWGREKSGMGGPESYNHHNQTRTLLHSPDASGHACRSGQVSLPRTHWAQRWAGVPAEAPFVPVTRVILSTEAYLPALHPTLSYPAWVLALDAAHLLPTS